MAQTRQRKLHKQQQPLQDGQKSTGTTEEVKGSTMDFIRRQPLWIVLAIASGTCAAFNGVFAKLTTTALTSTLAEHIATLFNLESDNVYINFALRALFFGLNVIFNIAMWALFTAALTKGSSTTRVSIINVSSNFMVTAVLGAIIFGEKLPLGWWLGAGLLAVGNVVIGRREEGKEEEVKVGQEEEALLSRDRESIDVRSSVEMRRHEREQRDGVI